MLIGESGMHRVLRIEADQTLSLVAGVPMGIVGAYAGDGGLATRARLHSACGVGQGADGQVFIGDMLGNRIRLVDREGSIISVAGTGLAGQPLGADGQPGPAGGRRLPGGRRRGARRTGVLRVAHREPCSFLDARSVLTSGPASESRRRPSRHLRDA